MPKGPQIPTIAKIPLISKEHLTSQQTNFYFFFFNSRSFLADLAYFSVQLLISYTILFFYHCIFSLLPQLSSRLVHSTLFWLDSTLKFVLVNYNKKEHTKKSTGKTC